MIVPPRNRNFIACNNFSKAFKEYGSGDTAMENVGIIMRTYLALARLLGLSRTIFTSVASTKLIMPFSPCCVIDVGNLSYCLMCFSPK